MLPQVADRPAGETGAADSRPVDKDRPGRGADPMRMLGPNSRRRLRLAGATLVRWRPRRSPLPAAASADSLEAYNNGVLPNSVAINTLWVIVAGMVVMFMQAGFAFLEIGFSRGKNAGTVIAKILTNFSIAALMYYAIGFAFAFGPGDIIGSDGFFLRDYGDPQETFAVMGLSTRRSSRSGSSSSSSAPSRSRSCGARRSSGSSSASTSSTRSSSPALIYPIASHWVFGGGWLQVNVGMQDFAGSTAVHMIGATGALAVLLLLGPRRGKYGSDGKPRAIPGHNMPLFGLGVLILWLGWFGFNAGSTLNAQDGRFPEIMLVTQLAAAAGVLTAIITAAWKTKSIDIGMAGNGAIGALVAITAPSGYVELWAAPIIGAIAGVIVAARRSTRSTSGSTTRSARSRRTASRASGARSRAASSPSPRLAQYNGFGDPDGGLFYSGSFDAARVPGARHRGRLHVRVRAVVRHVLADQEDLRAPRQRRGGGSRAGHLRARHVRVSRAVHPGA